MKEPGSHGVEVGRVLAKGMNNMLQWHIEVRICLCK